MLDLLVIGAGLTGLTAAYTAAKAGLNVRVVSKGLNALHWSAGTIDVLGYLPGANPLAVAQPLDALDDLLESIPGHPYGLIGRERLAEALRAFQVLSEEIGLPFHGADEGANLLLPSPAGAVRPAFLAPAAQVGGDLRQDQPLLIVGFAGLRDFYPRLIAENLNKQGYEVRAAQLPISLVSKRRDFNTVQLAREIEESGRAQTLGRALKGLVRTGERIGLPAFLGDTEHAAVMETLAKEAGAPIFEIPTLPPSVPGFRLFNALRDKLRQMGVRVEPGMEAIEFRAVPSQNGSADRVQWIATETSARPLKHRAKQFLLATGGILGGGFDSNHEGRVWEVVFDLPLTTPQKRSEWFRARFLDDEGHPVFNGGVAVNEAFQPVGSDGQIVYSNLWAAGNLLAHCNAIQERSMEGLAIVSGTVAAEKLAKQALTDR